MFLEFADKFKYGRILVLCLPFIAFALASALLPVDEIIQICNMLILILAVSMLWTYRQAISIYLKETKEASLIWLSIGIFVMVIATIGRVSYSFVYRMNDWTIDPSSRIISIIRFMNALSFGCLYLVPQAKNRKIPPAGWMSLVAISFISAAIVIVANHNPF